MRSEFNEAFKEHRQEGKSYSAEYKLGALWAWDYRQSKVDELQKRVDAVKQLIQEYRDPPTEDKTFCHALSIVAYELEQALKGGLDE
jgi:DNA/RNA-binding domain of Phe-tRNA-synthetase-like protein